MTRFRKLSFKNMSHRRRGSRTDAPPSPGQGSSSDSSRLPPFAGYERLDTGEVVADLATHSQVELTAIESFESSHRDRTAVLNKLRYLRGSEPIAHYDGLDLEALATAIGGADDATLVRMRTYERKFQNRSEVLEPVADALRAHRLAVGSASVGSA
jgi:hypothetical protein